MGASTQAGNLASQLGGSLIGGITSEAMGLIFNETNNENQLHQQDALDKLQLQYNEDYSSFQTGQQENIWDYTNYENQVKHLQAAGLNPSLLYGQRGGGGATTGSAVGASAPGAQAPAVSSAQTAQLAIQSQEAQADINLKNAQAENLKAKTPGEAPLMGAQTQSLLQGVQNMKAQETLTTMQTQAQEINNKIQGQTVDDQIATIRAGAQTMENQAQEAVRNNYIEH